MTMNKQSPLAAIFVYFALSKMSGVMVNFVCISSVSVGGIMVSIAAFQAVDPGSIPGRRRFFSPFRLTCVMDPIKKVSSQFVPSFRGVAVITSV